MTPEAVQELAVRLAASGIAAGAVAARYTAALCGHENVIGVDMGGTSTDISLVHDGELRTTNEWFVEYGHPICFPSIEVLTIGAGGGSLAHDRRRRLAAQRPAVGRLATPVPAAYGQGGEEPTNTDANLVLGRLGDAAWSAAACRSTATPPRRRSARASPSRSDLELHEAADAIIAVANANMADAVRIISLQRGYDPREFALVVFGGAGPLHGAALAKELGVPTVLVPPRPGTWSALGCLMVDIRHDLSEMFLRAGRRRRRRTSSTRRSGASRTRAASCSRPRASSEDDVTLERSIAMRYLGQWRSMEVGVRRRPRRGRRALPRRARARVLLPPRRRAGRALPAPARGHGQDRGRSSCREHERGRRAARAGRAPRRSASTARRSRRPSTSATTCRPACASRARP